MMIHDTNEQNQSWHARSNRPVDQLLSLTTHDPSHKPPIQASLQSRVKLKRFQFQGQQLPPVTEPRPVEQKGASEHAEASTRCEMMASPGAMHHEKSRDQNPSLTPAVGKENMPPEHTQPSSQCRRDCPQTPAGRLPLSQLLGVNDDGKTGDADSPMERVLWENTQPQRSSTMPGKRKRAFSSSPASSQGSTRKAPRDKAVLQELLKTPKGDPIDELWSRYMATSNCLTPSNTKPNPFHRVSPGVPLLDGQGKEILRRAVSCIDWPTSAAKRRKLQSHMEPRMAAADFVEAQKSAHKAREARMSFLVEQVSKDLSIGRKDDHTLSKDRHCRNASPCSSFEDNDLDVELVVAMDKEDAISPSKEATKDAAGPASVLHQDKTQEAFDVLDDEALLSAALEQASRVPSEQERHSHFQACSEMRKKEDFDDDEPLLSAAIEEVFAQFESSGPSPHPAKDSAQRQVSDEEDFGSDVEFDDVTATKLHHDRPSTFHRFVIKTVDEAYQVLTDGRSRREKIVSIQHERDKSTKLIILRQAWLDTECLPGSHIHVIGDFDTSGTCVVDNARNFVVVNPDHLISATVVGDSFTCTRKAVLQDRVKATSDASQVTAYGHMLHEIFQEAMQANCWDDDFLARTIMAVAKRYLETLFEINVELDVAVEHLKSRCAHLQNWAQVYVAENPETAATVQDRNGTTTQMSIKRLLEVEEHVWAPSYGLKGNIDATVEIQLKEGASSETLTAPFELKTGKLTNAAHKAQTSLYTLLLSDRYDVNIACGILYYMQTGEISAVRTIRHEIVPMIIQRNTLAAYVRNKTLLPPMLQKSYTCGKCYAQTPCFIYHKMLEDGSADSSAMGQKFDLLTQHLNSQHRDFFRKWETLLTKEEGDLVKIRRELWTMTSHERRAVGRCFGDLIIDSSAAQEVNESSRISRFSYTLKNRTGDDPFIESQIAVGEPIVVSDQCGHYALANGYVTGMRRHAIDIAVDRQLHHRRAGNSPLVLRLDKDEFSNGMAMIRNNLVRLMEKDVFAVRALRELIIEGRSPVFTPGAKPRATAELNIDQRAAIDKVMSAQDYALVLGMPGTGKTTTIAHIIHALVDQGKSVLLTSYTHTAVDNILLKLQPRNPGVFRLGAKAKVHPEVAAFADMAAEVPADMEELQRCYNRPIVATTCLGISHPIFNQRTFDYCIVDEASQITLPVCLGPIRMARTFILVGDHYQLPPLVQNKEAQAGGLDVSLFRSLSEAHPDAVVSLEHQYRMCADIMALSNELIYHGRLKCGTPDVARRSLHIPQMQRLREHHHTPRSVLTTTSSQICASSIRGTCWLRDLLEPEVRACFVDTDALAAREQLEQGTRLTNPGEATITVQLVEALLTVGLQSTDIGVITLYRSQLALIKQALRHRPQVEMHTADRFQGRDKEVIILSMVRSNESRNVGDLLKDWRRVNVALTRARTKLLILGSRQTLQSNELLGRLLRLMQGRQWIYALPRGACSDHVFAEELGEPRADGGQPVSAGKQNGLLSKGDISLGRPAKGRMEPKQAKLDVQRLLKRRPVLADVVNESGL